MKKSWGLTGKILAGKKTIESRWLSIRCRPWGAVKPGDLVFFKDSGEPVTLRAEIRKVLQFTNLNQKKVKHLLSAYGEDDGIDSSELPAYFQRFKNKKYCMLIFLKNPHPVKPFEIDKKGFGAMSAWISVQSISTIRNTSPKKK